MLFSQFNAFLLGKGFRSQKVKRADANIVSGLTQRNSREENQQIKAGGKPENWSNHKRGQKHWTKKNGRNFFGYKNHISADVKHKSGLYAIGMLWIMKELRCSNCRHTRRSTILMNV